MKNTNTIFASKTENKEYVVNIIFQTPNGEKPTVHYIDAASKADARENALNEISSGAKYSFSVGKIYQCIRPDYAAADIYDIAAEICRKTSAQMIRRGTYNNKATIEAQSTREIDGDIYNFTSYKANNGKCDNVSINTVNFAYYLYNAARLFKCDKYLNITSENADIKDCMQTVAAALWEAYGNGDEIEDIYKYGYKVLNKYLASWVKHNQRNMPIEISLDDEENPIDLIAVSGRIANIISDNVYIANILDIDEYKDIDTYLLNIQKLISEIKSNIKAYKNKSVYKCFTLIAVKGYTQTAAAAALQVSQPMVVKYVKQWRAIAYETAEKYDKIGILKK